MPSVGIVAPCAPVECCNACPCEGPKKVCVAEPKKNTKVVYNSKCQEYCLPRCGCFLSRMFGRGSCDCPDGNCGEVRTRHVLVKKKVPDCDTMTCVVKEVACEAPCVGAVAVPVVVPAPVPVHVQGDVLVPLPPPEKLHHGKH